MANLKTFKRFLAEAMLKPVGDYISDDDVKFIHRSIKKFLKSDSVTYHTDEKIDYVLEDEDFEVKKIRGITVQAIEVGLTLPKGMNDSTKSQIMQSLAFALNKDYDNYSDDEGLKQRLVGYANINTKANTFDLTLI